MMNGNSSSAIKRRNKVAIFRQLLRGSEATKPELAAALQLSLPTVGQIVGELIEAGLVEENGLVASLGGRRPVSVQINSKKWVALGVDITAHHISFSIVDLTEKIVAHERLEMLFIPGEDYIQRIMPYIQTFFSRNGILMENLLGVGVSLPGIVNPDQTALVTSHLLQVVNEPLLFHAPGLFPCPVHYFNDASAACLVECYAEDAPDSFLFLSLSNSVGGAMVINKRIVSGMNGRNGELGHVCIVPNGRQCYCGKLGHYDAYGAAWLLAEKADGDLAQFFARVAEGDPALNAVFEEYLDALALLVCNSIMFTDLPMIIGGYVGNYLGPYLPRLKQKVVDMDIFGQDDPDIRLCRHKEEAAATGSAMYFVEQLIENL